MISTDSILSGYFEVITLSVGDSFSPADVSRTKAKLSVAYPAT